VRPRALNSMGTNDSGDLVDEFTLGLLRAGWMLCGLAADLTEAMPDDAYPGEKPAHVVMEMMTGTIRTAIGSADERDLERATDLITEACDRVIEHLELALKLAERMGDASDGGRAHLRLRLTNDPPDSRAWRKRPGSSTS
jgi:hypothetical protein